MPVTSFKIYVLFRYYADNKVMKKKLFFALFFLCAFFSASQNLNGIWENQHRIIEFGEDSATFVLKLFYGWYYDHSVTLRCVQSASGVSELAELAYPSYKINLKYPLAIIADSLFLDFYLRGSAFDKKSDADSPITENDKPDTEKNSLTGFWRPGGNRYEMSVNFPEYKSEIYGYFFTDSDAYRVRYWLTEMPYGEIPASVTDGNFSFTVDKYLTIGDQVYTCVNGRGTSVRNIEKIPYKVTGDSILFLYDSPSPVPLTLSDDFLVLSFSSPYLKRTSIENLNAEIDAMNARRRPPPKPLFPPSGFNANFYWEEIQSLRSNMGGLAQLVLTNQLFSRRLRSTEN